MINEHREKKNIDRRVPRGGSQNVSRMCMLELFAFEEDIEELDRLHIDDEEEGDSRGCVIAYELNEDR